MKDVDTEFVAAVANQAKFEHRIEGGMRIGPDISLSLLVEIILKSEREVIESDNPQKSEVDKQ